MTHRYDLIWARPGPIRKFRAVLFSLTEPVPADPRGSPENNAPVEGNAIRRSASFSVRIA